MRPAVRQNVRQRQTSKYMAVGFSCVGSAMRHVSTDSATRCNILIDWGEEFIVTWIVVRVVDHASCVLNILDPSEHGRVSLGELRIFVQVMFGWIWSITCSVSPKYESFVSRSDCAYSPYFNIPQLGSYE